MKGQPSDGSSKDTMTHKAATFASKGALRPKAARSAWGGDECRGHMILKRRVMCVWRHNLPKKDVHNQRGLPGPKRRGQLAGAKASS